jgi:hypothetical protein
MKNVVIADKKENITITPIIRQFCSNEGTANEIFPFLPIL